MPNETDPVSVAQTGAPVSAAKPGLSRARVFELGRFLLVGGFSTLLYFAVYTAIVVAGLPYGLGVVGGWAAGVTFGFVMHHRFTFRTGATRTAGLRGWLLLQAGVQLVNFLGLGVLIHAFGVPAILAQLVLLPLIPLTTYFLSRRFIFLVSSPDEPDPGGPD